MIIAVRHLTMRRTISPADRLSYRLSIVWLCYVEIAEKRLWLRIADLVRCASGKERIGGRYHSPCTITCLIKSIGSSSQGRSKTIQPTCFIVSLLLLAAAYEFLRRRHLLITSFWKIA